MFVQTKDGWHFKKEKLTIPISRNGFHKHPTTLYLTALDIL